VKEPERIITMFELKYNNKMNRWEVFRRGRNVIRGGEVQPVFVSGNVFDAWEFVKRCES
jgi:hypothetical protein